MREVSYNSKNVSDYFMLSDATGVPKTGVLATDVTGSYVRQNGARVGITMSALAAVTSAFSGGGFIEIDAATCPGLYRVDIPDAAFLYTAGVKKMYVELKGGVVFKAEAKEFYLVAPSITEGSTTQTGANPYTFSDGTVRLNN